MEAKQNNENQLTEIVKILRSIVFEMKKFNLPKEQWLDTADVCKRLRISPRKLAGLRASNKLPYEKKGAKIYHHITDVDNYPDSGRRHKKEKQ